MNLAQLHWVLRGYCVRRPSRKWVMPVELVAGFNPPRLETNGSGHTSVVAGIGWVIQNYYMS